MTDKIPPGYKKTEIGIISEEWKVKRLGEVSEQITDYVANGSFATLKEKVKVYVKENYAYYVRLYDFRLTEKLHISPERYAVFIWNLA